MQCAATTCLSKLTTKSFLNLILRIRRVLKLTYFLSKLSTFCLLLLLLLLPELSTFSLLLLLLLLLSELSTICLLLLFWPLLELRKLLCWNFFNDCDTSSLLSSTLNSGSVAKLGNFPWLFVKLWSFVDTCKVVRSWHSCWSCHKHCSWKGSWHSIG